MPPANPGAAPASPSDIGALVDGRIPDAYRQVVPRIEALLSGVTGKPAVDGLSPKAIAVSDTMVFVWDPPTKSVRMVRLDRHAPETVTILQPDRAVPDDVKQLAVSIDGSHLALIADDDVSVLKVPEPRVAVGHRADSGPKICHTATVGHAHNTKVCQVRWHPLAPECLVILNGDGWLRLYDIGKADERGAHLRPCVAAKCTPEKRDEFRQHGYNPVAFDFGPPSDWCALTIFILLENGELHYLCPVVPPRTELPKRVLDDIRMASHDNTAHAWVDRLQQAGELHIETLDDTFEPPLVIGLPPLVGDGTPLLQGPYKILPESAAGSSFLGCVGMLSLAVLPRHAPTVLATVDAQGDVNVVTLLDQVQPCWSHGTGATRGNEADAPAVWVLERINLGFGPVTVAEDANYAEIVIDRTYPSRIYVYHPHGLDEIHMVYLEAFAEHAQAANPEEHPLPKTMESVAVRHTTYLGPSDAPPTVTLVGFGLVDHPQAGYHLVTLFSDGRPEIQWMDLPRADLPAASLEYPSAKSEPEWRQPTLVAATPNGVKVKGEPGPEDVVEVTECFRIVKEYVTQITDRVKPIVEKTRMLEERKIVQQQKVAQGLQLAKQLADELVETENAMELLEERTIQLTTDFENQLRLYDLCLDHMHSVIPDTSEAEVKYQKSIKQLEEETRHLQKSAAMVAEKCRRGVAEGMGGEHPPFPSPADYACTPEESLAKIKESALKRPDASSGRKGLERMHRELERLTDDVKLLSVAVEDEEREFFTVTATTAPQ